MRFYLVRSNKDKHEPVARVVDDELYLLEVLEQCGYTIDRKDDEFLDICICSESFELAYVDTKGRVFAFVDKKYHRELVDIVDWAGIYFYFLYNGDIHSLLN